MNMTPKETAIKAAQLGLVTVPPQQDGTKRPGHPNWGDLRTNPLTPQQLADMYDAGGLTGVGLVTGSCSKNLECLDFDDQSAAGEFATHCDRAGLLDLWERVRTGYFEHSPNGAHALWYCSEIGGNQKLAASAEGKTLLETRGEGGYIITAPTSGRVNKSGPYLMQSGGLESITTITPSERQELLRIARIMDKTPRQEEVVAAPSHTGPQRAGDEYNEKAEWADILQPHDWKKLGTYSGVTQWRRPGKTVGTSATTNHSGTDAFFVFSSSTEFEPERNYSKFAVYAILNHAGDFGAASRELYNMGFGQDDDSDWDVSIAPSVPVEEPLNPFGRPIPPHLLDVPGFLGEFCAHVAETSHRQQPVLALGAGLAVMSNLVGRRVQTESGMRSNGYFVGVAHTGSGKERARQVIKDVFSQVGQQHRVAIASATGDTAVEVCLQQEPCSLAPMDEFGHILQGIKDGQGRGGPMASLATVLLNLFGEAQTIHFGKVFSAREQIVIQQPCLSIYGTTTPEGLCSNVSPKNMRDGFLNRMLFFFSENPLPPKQMVTKRKLPGSMLSFARQWIEYGDGSSDQVIPCIPDPQTVTCTAEARSTLNAFSSMLDERKESLLRGGKEEEYSMWSRADEYAERLALLRACSVCSPDVAWPTIGASDARWGVELVAFLTEKAIHVLEREMAEGKQQALCNAISQELEKSPAGWQYLSYICRRGKLRNMVHMYDDRTVQSAVSALLLTGEIERTGKKIRLSK